MHTNTNVFKRSLVHTNYICLYTGADVYIDENICKPIGIGKHVTYRHDLHHTKTSGFTWRRAFKREPAARRPSICSKVLRVKLWYCYSLVLVQNFRCVATLALQHRGRDVSPFVSLRAHHLCHIRPIYLNNYEKDGTTRLNGIITVSKRDDFIAQAILSLNHSQVSTSILGISEEQNWQKVLEYLCLQWRTLCFNFATGQSNRPHSWSFIM